MDDQSPRPLVTHASDEAVWPANAQLRSRAASTHCALCSHVT
jgi:hypothetical protein